MTRDWVGGKNNFLIDLLYLKIGVVKLLTLAKPTLLNTQDSSIRLEMRNRADPAQTDDNKSR